MLQIIVLSLSPSLPPSLSPFLSSSISHPKREREREREREMKKELMMTHTPVDSAVQSNPHFILSLQLALPAWRSPGIEASPDNPSIRGIKERARRALRRPESSSSVTVSPLLQLDRADTIWSCLQQDKNESKSQPPPPCTANLLHLSTIHYSLSGLPRLPRLALIHAFLENGHQGKPEIHESFQGHFRMHRMRYFRFQKVS